MADASVLIVEDDPDLRRVVADHLRREGFDVRTASTGGEALGALEAQVPSVVLLDLGLPDMRGIEVCRIVRADPAMTQVRVVVLSARSEEIDRVVAFEVGADDYVVKSQLSLRELTLRVRAVSRRDAIEAPVQRATRPSDLRVDLQSHRAWARGSELQLTPTEFRVLHALTQQPGRVLTREDLVSVVWDGARLDARTVDTHVKRLREKLGPVKDAIVTVRGVGYRYEPSA